MSAHHHSYRIEGESDEYVSVTVEPVPPTWRDIWAIVRGRYQPKVVRVARLTTKGMDRELRRVYTSESLERALYRQTFLDMSGQRQGTAVVPLHKGANDGAEKPENEQ